MRTSLSRLRPALASILISALLLLAAATWIAVRAESLTDGAPVITDAGFGAGLTVDPRPGDPSPLRAGDVVVAIDGLPLDQWLAGDGPSRAPIRAGTELTYQVLRDDRSLEVTVPIRRGDLVLERLRDTGSPVIGLLVFLVGVYVVARRPEQPAARALLLLGSGLATYDVFGVLSADTAHVVSARWMLAAGIGGTFAGLAVWTTAATQLALTFPAPVSALRRRPWLIGVLYTVVVLGSAGAAVVHLGWGSGSLAGLDRINAGFVGALYASVALILAGVLRTILRAYRDPVTRRQGLLVVLGLGTTVALNLIANIVNGDDSQRWPFWYDALMFLPLTAALAVAILRGEFLDIRATVNRAFVYLVLTGVLLALFAVTVAAVAALAGESGVAETVPAAAVVAVAFAPVRARVQRGVDRLLYGERGDPLRVLGALGERLAAATPAEQVLPTIAETLAVALRLPYVAIATSVGGSPRLACERGEPPVAPESVPLVHQGRCVGELLIGPRRGEHSVSDHDLTLLGDVARQIAAAVSAASLVTEIAASRSQLSVAREEERARLRYDLHDRLGSHLVGLSLLLDTVEKRAEAAPVRDIVSAAHTEAERALEEVRRISRGLRPAELDELGLVAAVDAAATRLTVGDTGTPWRASVAAAVQLPVLSPATEAAAYHIAVEALTNAYRHSGGTRARVRVGVDARGQTLTVAISDNGSGFSLTAGIGVGLRSMRDRAAGVGGCLALSDPTGGGSLVRAELPLEAPAVEL